MLSSLGRAAVRAPLLSGSRPGCARHLSHFEQRRLRTPRVPQLHGPLTTAAAASSSVSIADANDTIFWRVVIATGLTLLLCSVDRICMSVAILPMAAEFSWSPWVQGVVQAAFLVGYAMTQAIGGALADRVGGKVVTAYAIKLFSLASLVLPICLRVAPVEYTLAIVVAVRFLVGVGEGFVLPSMNSAVGAQISPLARSRALGIMFALFHSGNLVGLALSPLIIQNYGWHALFFTYGIAGLPLLALWYLIMPEAAPSESSAQSDDATPAYTPPGQYSPRIPPGREVKAPDKGSGQSRGANSPRIPPGREANAPPSTRATASAFPVREGRRGESLVLKAPSVEPGSITDFLQHPPVLAIAVANVANHWGYFIFQAWIPAFFAYEFGFNIAEASMMAFAPWIAMAVGSAGAGVLADHLITRMPVLRVRRIIQCTAFLVPALALAGLAALPLSATQAMFVFVAALGIQALGQAGFVANMSDIAPRNAGTVFGLCNTVGCLAGIIGVALAGQLYQATGSFNALFFMTCALYAVGAVTFLLFSKADPIFGEV